MEQNQQSTAEQYSEQIEQLMELGRTQGYLTYAEINDLLPEDLIDPEYYDKLLQTLQHDAGIPVLDEAPESDEMMLNDTIPDEDTFINACKAAFTLSRRNSLGFGPSRNRHRKNTVAARKSRQENDDEESQKRYTDGDSISSDLLTRILLDISKDVYALLMEYKSQTKQFLQAVQATAILFCPDPDSHKLIWDMCFIPLFQTKICDDLRSKLNQDIITALEYGKTDIWDNGARAYW